MNKPILVMTISFLILLGFIKFALWPKISEYLIVSNNLKTAQVNQTESTKYYQEVSSQYQGVQGEFQNEIRIIDAALPDEKFTPELFHHFHQTLTGRSGLVLDGISIGKDVSKEISGTPIIYTDVSVTVQGTYQSFKNFLQSIEESERFIDLASFEFSVPEKDNAPMKFNAVTRVYRLK